MAAPCRRRAARVCAETLSMTALGRVALGGSRRSPMIRRDFMRAGLAAPALLAFRVAPASAQEAYPSRPIRLVVPFPAGGPTDIIGRKFAQRAAQELGQQIVVENKAG